MDPRRTAGHPARDGVPRGGNRTTVLIKIFRRLRRAHSSPAARSHIRIFVACGALIEKFLPSSFSAPPALPIESFLT